MIKQARLNIYSVLIINSLAEVERCCDISWIQKIRSQDNLSSDHLHEAVSPVSRLLSAAELCSLT